MRYLTPYLMPFLALYLTPYLIEAMGVDALGFFCQGPPGWTDFCALLMANSTEKPPLIRNAFSQGGGRGRNPP